MTDYFELLKTIADEFNIKQGNSESEVSWMARVVYSYLGQVGYSSLWDIQEDLLPPTITHFKTRIEKSLESILDIYPELIGVFSMDSTQQSDEIYKIFLDSGNVYHQPNRLSVPAPQYGVGKNNHYLRGNPISEKRCISGLGSYNPISQSEGIQTVPIAFFFQLMEKSLGDTWKDIISNAHWVNADETRGMQYLLTKPPYKSSYWTNIPDLAGEISLARQGLPGSYLYYLYRAVGRRTTFSQLPLWMTKEGNYRILSNACLHARGTLLPTYYKLDGEIVYLRFGYLLPLEEMNFVRLYSWPTIFVAYPHDFSRVMARSVFEDLRTILEETGFQFQEE